MKTDTTAAQLARELARIRWRWPATAEAAGHPLTEVLVQIDRRRGRKMIRAIVFAVATVFLLVIPMMAPVLLPALSHTRLSSPWMIGLFAFALVALNWARGLMQGAIHKNKGGFAEIFSRGDPERLMELWMTPLAFRDMLGAETGRALIRHREKRTGALLVVLGGIALLCAILHRIGVWPQSVFAHLLFFAGLLAFLTPILLHTPEAAASAAMQRTMEALDACKDASRSRWRPLGGLGRKGAVSPKALAIKFAAFLLLTIPVLAFSPPQGMDNWFIVFGLCALLIELVYSLLQTVERPSLDWELRDSASTGQTLYEEMIRDLVERHSSVNL
ncbi:MAG: hypothetical protein NTW86_32960 [Candidatus Sumerlaeota bacterium]|nr:hypothetical protein [Candidatus Sumerlaeota bacterium]